MARHLKLRPLTRSEQRLLRSKLRDLTLSVRVHQRYRVIDQVQRGFSLLEASERVGCHFTVGYDWVHRFNETGFSTFEQVPNPKGRVSIALATKQVVSRRNCSRWATFTVLVIIGLLASTNIAQDAS